MSDKKKSAASDEMHPALQAYLTSKNERQGVSKTAATHLVQPAITMMRVVDKLDPELKDTQKFLNDIELERLANEKKFRDGNPYFKNRNKKLPAHISAHISAPFTERTNDIVDLVSQRIKSIFKENKVGEFGDEAANAITTQMKTIATDSAVAATSEADLAAVVKAAATHVSDTAGGHGGGPKKGDDKNR